MFTRGSRRRRSEREAEDPDRGRPCRVCRDLCPGFQEHGWRKICQHCKCPRGEHVGGGVPPALQGVLARLLPQFQPPPTPTPPQGSPEDSGCSPQEFAWTPPGLSPDLVSRYFSELPPALVPRIHSPGERHRLRELLRQLPPHDLEPQFCHDLAESERRELKLFAQRRKRENLGQGSVRPLPPSSPGTVCQQCGGPVLGGSLAVFAARAGLGLCWHPRCFRCCRCHQPLVDLVYFCPGGRGGRLLCGRHHGETLRDRCPGCDELIFGGPCAQAGGRRWHRRHLLCEECEGPLDPQNLQEGGEGRPLCPPCHARGAHLCDTCGDPIAPQAPHVSHGGQHWHPLPSCFRCAPCGVSLLGRPFLPRGGQIFCSPHCARGPPRGPPRGPSGSPPRESPREHPRGPPKRSSWGGGPPAGWQPRFRRAGPHRHSMPELGATPRPSPPAPTTPPPPPSSRGPSPLCVTSNGPSPLRGPSPLCVTSNGPSPLRVTSRGPSPTHIPSNGPSPLRVTPPPTRPGPSPFPSPPGPPRIPPQTWWGRGRPRWSSSSSSSSSSTEGLFLGEPIPLPPQLRPPGAPPDPPTPPQPRPRSRGCRLA